MPFLKRTHPPKVLVVDDDEGLGVLVVGSLSESGVDARPAHSAREAIDCLKAEKFDLMLLDLGLKDVSGKALLEMIKAQQIEIPFLVVTGRGDERTAVDMMKTGALDYVIKDARMLDRLPLIVTRAIDKLDRDGALTSARKALLESEKEILAISELERKSIGADLHDNLGQQLTAIEMLCQGLREDLQKQPKLAAQMAQVCRHLQESVAQTRLLARGLTPVPLSAEGLIVSLADLTRQMGGGPMKCRFDCPAEIDIPDNTMATHLFRIAQEAVNNALKHSRASRVDLRLIADGDFLTLTIEDDGRGLPEKKDSSAGLGLQIMRHRSNVIGGTLEIESSGSGVSIICRVRKGP